MLFLKPLFCSLKWSAEFFDLMQANKSLLIEFRSLVTSGAHALRLALGVVKGLSGSLATWHTQTLGTR